MSPTISIGDIRRLGFDWPKHALIEQTCVVEGDEVDLERTVQGLRTSQAYYEKQLRDAFAFKWQTGADYSDFTDKFDDYARAKRELGVAIAYLEEIMQAVEALQR